MKGKLSLSLGRLAMKYIFFETLPSFLFGVVVFVFILLMFQALRLTEFVLVHGVELQTILKIMTYLTVSFLPVILPMSLLFAVLLTYGRLSHDSEIVAFKSLGLNHFHIALPAFVLAICASIASAHTSFSLAPWGNRKFEVIIDKMKKTKAATTLRAGVFSEGFYDLVIYTNDVDEDTGELKKVFIYDERSSESPLTIISQEGQIINNPNMPGHKSLLRLRKGSIHRTQSKNYTKIDFETYDVNLFDPVDTSFKEKTLLSLTLDELKIKLLDKKLSKKNHLKIKTEYYKRWALSFSCIIFVLIGTGLSITANNRASKSNGVVTSIGLIVLYWILYVTFEGFARNGTLPALLSVWIPNVFYLTWGSWVTYRSI
ncbi:MAG: LPS export ABC transporter permease LptF [Bdellovibrionaceae bacterium]|jgi:lipopolysaccharide export system permease protein|nr:LPS export ABC transporter permease LptF [Pseudobdellovibrionaceae bacterium]